MATGTTFRILRSGDGRYYGAFPDGDNPLSLDDLKMYGFAISLLWYTANEEPEPAPVTPYTRVPVWMGEFAQHAGIDFNSAGDFGQIDFQNTNWAARAAAFGGNGEPVLDASTVPEVSDSPQIVTTTNTTPNWTSGAWSSQGWDHIVTMPDNFNQEDLTPEDYEPRIQEQITNVLGVLPPPSKYIWVVNWHEPTIQPIPPVDVRNMPGQSAEAQAYRDYLRGNFRTWHIESQDLTIEDNPSLNYVSCPTGPVWANLWENETYLQNLNSSVFFGDVAPHGTETMYFISAMIMFRMMYLRKVGFSGYVPPVGTSIDPAVLNNLNDIEDRIEIYLNQENQNGFRVYL